MAKAYKKDDHEFSTEAVAVMTGLGVLAGAAIGLATGGVGLVMMGTAFGLSGPAAGAIAGGAAMALTSGSLEATGPTKSRAKRRRK